MTYYDFNPSTHVCLRTEVTSRGRMVVGLTPSVQHRSTMALEYNIPCLLSRREVSTQWSIVQSTDGRLHTSQRPKVLEEARLAERI